jgi:hypothetical protein
VAAHHVFKDEGAIHVDLDGNRKHDVFKLHGGLLSVRIVTGRLGLKATMRSISAPHAGT